MNLSSLLLIAAGVLIGEIILAGALSLVHRLGRVGHRVSESLCRAPMLDLVMAVLTLVPPIAAVVIWSWEGMVAAIGGQLLAVPVWVLMHETMHRQVARGPRLVKAQNAIAGRWRNHAALWFSVSALPVFWVVRLGEIVLYLPLRWLLGFPRYRHGEWVNVSRHKFDGLVGHDLIWCLYCDWMTGIYSLAGEMLRNVESFWCPIRFYDGKKCENCKLDFPDVERWATPDGTVAPVVRLIEDQYDEDRREWFGHPARLTVNGETLSSGTSTNRAPVGRQGEGSRG